MREHARLRAATSMPISGGESLFTRYEFVPVFEKRAFDIVQPDAAGVGGITEAAAIAAMAEAHGVRPGRRSRPRRVRALPRRRVALHGRRAASGPRTVRRHFSAGGLPNHILGMKTAISLPDELFHAAERLARESRRSRSQLYADALADYVRRHAEDSVTTAMNRVVDQLGDRGADPAFAGAALQTLMRSEW